MKNQYTQYIEQLQELINLEYPSQKLYPGIIQDILVVLKQLEKELKKENERKEKTL